MTDFEDQYWTIVGSHPVELNGRHRRTPLDIFLVQRGHLLRTRVLEDGVHVDSLDSTGLLLRSLGVFSIDAGDRRTIRQDTTIDGVPCCIEMTLTRFRRAGSMLTGIVCPVTGPGLGGEEGAVGGFSAEVQGGLPGGDPG